MIFQGFINSVSISNVRALNMRLIPMYALQYCSFYLKDWWKLSMINSTDIRLITMIIQKN